jgi:hypothetical protein
VSEADTPVIDLQRRTLGTARGRRDRIVAVVLFFEILLVACTVVITWFALYAVYRLISDDS